MKDWQLLNPSTVYWDDWALFSVQILTLVALVVYVWKTWEMASATRDAAEASRKLIEEARDERAESLAPRIVVFFDGTPGLAAQVIIQNAGAGTAADLRLEFNPPLRSTSFGDTLQFFNTPQPIFPPGYRLAQAFDGWPNYLASGFPKQFTVRTTYRGVENGRSYDMSHRLDAEAMRHRISFEGKGVHELVGVFEKFSAALDRRLETIERKIDPDVRLADLWDRPIADPEIHVRRLVGVWRSQRTIGRKGESWIAYKPVLDLVRADALAANTALETRASDGARARAVADTLQLLFHYHALAIGNEEWQREVDQSIERLASLFELPAYGGGESDPSAA